MLYDIIVIGAGPAGVIAAIENGKKGLKVCLVEQNNYIGKKLAITGGGRCNITSKININEFENKIPQNYKFIQSSLKQFSNLDLINYLKDIKIDIKAEGDKIYLKSENGQTFTQKLNTLLNEYNITIRLNTKVTDILFSHKKVEGIKTTKEILKGKKYLLASGGLSYPSFGSDGSILDILSKKNVVTIVSPKPCLVPINLKKNSFSELSGIAIEASIGLEFGKIKRSLDGELLFTHKGLSGPLALNFSSYLVHLNKGTYIIWLDFLPRLSGTELLNMFQKIKGKEKISTILKEKLPKNLVKQLFPIDIYDFSNLNKKQLENIVSNLKKYTIEIEDFEGYNKAIITRGGVSVKEIDPKTMKCKNIDNLYFAGEIIDVDGLTGGYNLQIAFSTGYVAGKNLGGI